MTRVVIIESERGWGQKSSVSTTTGPMMTSHRSTTITFSPGLIRGSLLECLSRTET